MMVTWQEVMRIERVSSWWLMPDGSSMALYHDTRVSANSIRSRGRKPGSKTKILIWIYIYLFSVDNITEIVANIFKLLQTNLSQSLFYITVNNSYSTHEIKSFFFLRFSFQIPRRDDVLPTKNYLHPQNIFIFIIY